MATSKKPSQKEPLISPSQDFLRSLLYEDDPKTAEEKARKRAGTAFDASEKGSRLARLEKEYAEISPRYTSSLRVLEELEHKRYHTPKHVPSGNKDNVIPYREWKFRDKVFAFILSIASLFVMYAGGANVYSNLMSEIVFLENPSLAISIAALIPTGSIGIKFISGYFSFEDTKRRYALWIFSLTAIFILAWSAVFAMNFNGAAGSIDWDTIGESNDSKGALLVWIQITCELLVAASIFLALEHITSKYAPEELKTNKNWLTTEKAIKDHMLIHKPLRDEYIEIFTAKSMLANERESLCTHWSDQYMALYRRLNAVNTL